jgi:hypothetical protein
MKINLKIKSHLVPSKDKDIFKNEKQLRILYSIFIIAKSNIIF